MLFQGRFEKQLKSISKRNSDSKRAYDEEELASKLEKGDLPAMIISAMIIILPVALLFLVAISLIGFFFIVR